MKQNIFDSLLFSFLQPYNLQKIQKIFIFDIFPVSYLMSNY
jgi:hypothetical protein